MKIVHEVETPMTCGAGGRSGTGRIEVYAFNDCAENHPDLSPHLFALRDEKIYIEGSIEYVRAMLKQMLACVENSIKYLGANSSTELPPESPANPKSPSSEPKQ